MKTPFQLHVAKWGQCRLCPLCETRDKVVFARGKLPADILLCGEGPGISENIRGIPFDGPAGKLLDQIVARALQGGWEHLRVVHCNLVMCIPLSPLTGQKIDKPEPEHVEACRPRLEEFIRIASPKLVVAVGGQPDDYLKQGFKGSVKVPDGVRIVTVRHPAAILRDNIAIQNLNRQRCVVTIRNAVDDVFGTEE